MILDAGVRAEWFTPGPDAKSMPNGSLSRDSWAFSPRLGMVYPLSRSDAVQFSYVRISQPPGRDYLYDSRFSRVDPRSPQGNPGLSPAIAISYELALKHRTNELWSGRGSLFYRDLFRQVSARSVPGARFGQSTLRYASDDAGRATGLELSVTRERAGSSAVSLTYTWMQAEGSESFEDGIPFYPLTLPQPPPIAENPLAWDQRHRLTFTALWSGSRWDLAWSSVLGSGLPWTPAERRQPAADLSMVHSRRLDWATLSDLTARKRLFSSRSPISVGLEVRNVFDFRGPRIVSIDGSPNPVINTAFDDYAAYRTETGRGGGAYWNDRDGDGSPGWVPVGDPRLDLAPRRIRLSVETGW
jgi:outer membrane receptor protein involved in Fe transport